MSIALVTGAEGFIGRNLTIRLGELGHEVIPIGRGEARRFRVPSGRCEPAAGPGGLRNRQPRFHQ